MGCNHLADAHQQHSQLRQTAQSRHQDNPSTSPPLTQCWCPHERPDHMDAPLRCQCFCINGVPLGSRWMQGSEHGYIPRNTKVATPSTANALKNDNPTQDNQARDLPIHAWACQRRMRMQPRTFSSRANTHQAPRSPHPKGMDTTQNNPTAISHWNVIPTTIG